jgi:hypothetical protein
VFPSIWNAFAADALANVFIHGVIVSRKIVAQAAQ